MGARRAHRAALDTRRKDGRVEGCYKAKVLLCFCGGNQCEIDFFGQVRPERAACCSLSIRRAAALLAKQGGLGKKSGLAAGYPTASPLSTAAQVT